MCGGIGFKISQIPKSEPNRVYGDEKARTIAKKGHAESRFWDARPVLPVASGDQVKLFDWGNRDKNLKLPLTGWAKKESLESGKWNYLKPEPVEIVAFQGVENGVWFDIEGNIEGVKIEHGGIERVYMETKPASEKYQKMTHHDREPVIIRN